MTIDKPTTTENKIHYFHYFRMYGCRSSW